LRRDRIVAPPVERRELDDRLRRYDDPGGMGRRVPDEPFQTLADVDQLLDAGIVS
jgi:hypothetical protein